MDRGWSDTPWANRRTTSRGLARPSNRCAWDEAHTRFAAADAQAALDAEDLERLAQSAYLTGRDEAGGEGWARAHQAFLDRDEVQPAVRCAFWLGMVLMVGIGAEASETRIGSAA